MAGPRAVAIVLSDGERGELGRRVRRRKIAHADAMRAQIVLLAADGLNNCAIAEEVGSSRMTVMTWRKRFASRRLDGLDDEPRCGAPRRIGDDKIADVVTKTLETMPSHATHWSTRSMAKASGLSVSTVHRIWNAFSLQPHRSETFKLSTDPQFLRRCETSLASTLTRRSALWCFASMKRAKFRRLTARNHCCRCAPAKPSGEPMTMSVMASPPCSPLSM